MKTLLLTFFALVLVGSVHAHPGSGIAVDGKGQVFFIDTGSGLWKIDTKGKLAHLNRQRFHWLALDENNRFGGTTLRHEPGADWEIAKVGSSPTALTCSDFPLAITAAGTLVYPRFASRKLELLSVSSAGRAGVFATIPRGVGGPLQWLNGLALGPGGSIYYTEDSAIWTISKAGRVSRFSQVSPLAGRPSIPGFSSKDGPVLRGLAVNAQGVVYVAAEADGRVLRITPAGKVTTLLQTQSPWAPTAVALFGENVYVMEFSHDTGDDRTKWMPRVRKITPDGRSTILATIDKMPGARLK